jgi:glycerol kinase
VIVGLTGFANRFHLARAVLEATAFQTRDLVEAMNQDFGLPLGSLKVDGGMVGNELLMQFQADQLGAPIVRPAVSETTALGAAYAAGLGAGFWSDLEELTQNWRAEKTWQPEMSQEERAKGYQGWLKAMERTLDWVE